MSDVLSFAIRRCMIPWLPVTDTRWYVLSVDPHQRIALASADKQPTMAEVQRLIGEIRADNPKAVEFLVIHGHALTFSMFEAFKPPPTANQIWLSDES